MKAGKLLLLFLPSFLFAVAGAQVIIQPDAGTGKDTYIDSFYTLNPGSNFINHGDYYALGLGVEECYPDGFSELCWRRVLIDFDLSAIKTDTSFNSAQLVLHTFAVNPSPIIDTTVFRVMRIIEPWHEDSVLWANQPSVDSLKYCEFTIKPGISDSLSIDITALAKGQLLQPDSSYGFMICYTVANRYGSVAAYSSDCQTPELRPRLVIDYGPADLPEQCAALNVSVYPNPFRRQLTIHTVSLGGQGLILALKNCMGQTIAHPMQLNDNQYTFFTDDLPVGVYFLQFAEKGFTTIRKLIKE